jgi:hypothetical protein
VAQPYLRPPPDNRSSYVHIHGQADGLEQLKYLAAQFSRARSVQLHIPLEEPDYNYKYSDLPNPTVDSRRSELWVVPDGVLLNPTWRQDVVIEEEFQNIISKGDEYRASFVGRTEIGGIAGFEGKLHMTNGTLSFSIGSGGDRVRNCGRGPQSSHLKTISKINALCFLLQQCKAGVVVADQIY